MPVGKAPTGTLLSALVGGRRGRHGRAERNVVCGVANDQLGERRVRARTRRTAARTD